jgi:hypothetical protein
LSNGDETVQAPMAGGLRQLNEQMNATLVQTLVHTV